MHEPTLIKDWLDTNLPADELLMGSATGGVWEDVAGASAQTPYVIYNVVGGANEDTAGARALNRTVVNIKVVSLLGTDKAKADAALARIDALLQDTKTEFGGARIRIKAVGPLPEYPEPAPGGSKIYKHQGSAWRFTVSGS